MAGASLAQQGQPHPQHAADASVSDPNKHTTGNENSHVPEPRLCRECEKGTQEYHKPGMYIVHVGEATARHGASTCDSCRLIQKAVETYQTSHPELQGKQWKLPQRAWDWQVVVDPVFTEPQNHSFVDSFTGMLAGFQNVMQNVLRPELPLQSAEDGTRTRLAISRPPGEVFPIKGILEAADVFSEPSSPGAFASMREQIKHCVKNHPKCMHTTKDRPLRLLKIDRDSNKVKVMDGNSTAGSYCALSHAWTAEDQRQFELNSSSEVRNMQGVLVETLPVALQDAVTISTEIGCDLLWVDSLCVFQNEPEEVRAEQARIHHIYGNAHLVIAASSSRTPSKRLLSPREPSIPFTFSYHGVSYNASVGKPITHDWSGPLLDGNPWAVQARLLANRMIHFGSDEMIWECKTKRQCECNTIDPHDNDGPSRWSRLPRGSSIKSVVADYLEDEESRAFPQDLWSELATQHARCTFSNDSHRVTALAPLASIISERLPETGAYLAGLWSSHLPDALGWSFGRGRDERLTLPRIVPTWSWMAWQGDSLWAQDRCNAIKIVQFTCNDWTNAVTHVDNIVSVSDPTNCSLIIEGSVSLIKRGREAGAKTQLAIKINWQDWGIIRVIWLKPSEMVGGAFERDGIDTVGEPDPSSVQIRQIRLV